MRRIPQLLVCLGLALPLTSGCEKKETSKATLETPSKKYELKLEKTEKKD